MNKLQQIQDFILTKIRNNEYGAGDKIPTEAELVKQFSASRMTVNKALCSLRDKGYLFSVRGKGTFVKKEVVKKRLNELTSFTEEMRRRGIKPITKTLEFSYNSVGLEEEKSSLKLKSTDSVYKIVRVRYNKETPIALDVTFLSEKAVGHIEYSEMGPSLYEYLQNVRGVAISYAVQKIRAIKADEFLAANLEVPLGDPILEVASVTYDKENRPFEVVHSYHVHDTYEFEQISTKPE